MTKTAINYYVMSSFYTIFMYKVYNTFIHHTTANNIPIYN